MRSFFHFLMSNVMKGHSGFRARMEFSKHPDLQELLQAMETSYGNEDLEECDASALSASPRGKKNSSAWKPRPLPSGAFLYSHPKLQKLEEVVVQHFRQCEAEAREAGSIAESRVMIFSQYRDSVREIADLLSRHAPLVRVMSFVGQASASKGTKGLSQKEQLEVGTEGCTHTGACASTRTHVWYVLCLCRLCGSLDKEVTTRWSPPVWGRRDWTSERWTSLSALMPTSHPSGGWGTSCCIALSSGRGTSC